MKLLQLTGMTALSLILTACGGGGSSGSSGNGGSGSTTPTNVAPVAEAGSETLLQNTPVSITLVATDADGDVLTYSVTTNPAFGTVSLSGNEATYTPNLDYSGADSFTFTANDATADSNAASVDLTIQATSSFEGRITKSDGTTVPNITVEALDSLGEIGLTTTSDADGKFTLTSLLDEDYVLNFVDTNYADQVLSVTMPGLKSITLPLDVTLIERGAAQTIDIDAGGMIAGGSGASVTLSPGSFVDSNGGAVTGNIEGSITPVDISNPQSLAAFPGDFTGVEDMNNTETSIASLGTVEYVFTQNDEPLQLSNGATAEIEIPLYSAIHPESGDTIQLNDEIALWSLNQDTGVWQQEGTGIVVANLDTPTGLALQATVSHFTWWNSDVAISTATVNVTVSGTLDGVANIFGQAQTKQGFRTANTSVVIGNTSNGMFIPADTETCIWVEYVNSAGASASTDAQCITAVANSTNNLTFVTQEEGPLDLRDSDVEATYFVGDPLNVSVDPFSLETAVSYSVTSGALPAGLSLSANSATTTEIIGIPTVIGVNTVTIEGTDSDNFTDSQTLTFNIIDTPPPSLAEPGILYAGIGDAISQAITVNDNGGDDPVSWIITLADGSAAPAGVSVSNGVFMVTSFDGATASYLVTAFNSKGASNSITLTVEDEANAPPTLPSGFALMLLEFSGPHSENLSNLASGNTPTSWTITSLNSAPTATITNAGVVTLPANGFFGQRDEYEVIAFNGTAASNVMRLELTYEDPTLNDPCFIDPNNC